MTPHSKQDERLGKVVFLICIVLIFVANVVFGQTNFNNHELVRHKVGDSWIATSMLAFDSNGDSIIFGSSFRPGPFDFDKIFVHTHGVNECVRGLVLAIQYENGVIDYLGSYNEKNCDGISWFYLSDEEKNRLKYRNIRGIELFNLDNYNKFTVDAFSFWQYYKTAINN